MFGRYNRCCCQNNYNPQVIENICNCVETTAEYADSTTSCECGYNSMTNQNENCGCGFDEEVSPFPTNPMLAQSYVPIQQMDKTFTPLCGLKMGTIFPELVSPYMPGQSMAEIEYLRQTNKIGEGCNG